MAERTYDFLEINRRGTKPRDHGLTELRGPYYDPIGPTYLRELLESMGEYIDIFKFGGGVLPLMPVAEVQRLIDICHEHDVLVSTGGVIEYVLTRGPDAVGKFIKESSSLGFDVIEVSTGMISVPVDDVLRIVEEVAEAGMRPKPEVGIQFGAGGTSTQNELATEGTTDPGWAISKARRFLDAGAYMIMVESEGITEQVTTWRTDVAERFVNELGLGNLMFEAAEQEVFTWYVKNYGPEVNLFIDHSQIIVLESLRRGTWGTISSWGRVHTYKP